MLPPSQFRFEEGGRLIIVGDIHGMKQSLEYVVVPFMRCDTLTHWMAFSVIC